MRFRSRLDRLGAERLPGGPGVMLMVPTEALMPTEADRLRELLNLARKSPAETAELDDLLRRAPEIEARLEGSRSCHLIYMSERESRL
jgi:hypothetical protein